MTGRVDLAAVVRVSDTELGDWGQCDGCGAHGRRTSAYGRAAGDTVGERWLGLVCPACRVVVRTRTPSR